MPHLKNFFGSFRALNTSLDFGWISSKEKVPHFKIFSGTYFGSRQKNYYSYYHSIYYFPTAITIPAFKNLWTKNFQKLRPFRKLCLLTCLLTQKPNFSFFARLPLVMPATHQAGPELEMGPRYCKVFLQRQLVLLVTITITITATITTTTIPAFKNL